MTTLRLIVASLAHHWRMHVAVALGVATGTAVLTGALLVGDSVRGSLRRLTLERLGRIDEVLLVGRFFRAELADELAHEPTFSEHFESAVPAILLQGSVEHPQLRPQQTSRASKVMLLGCDERFWKLGTRPVDVRLSGDVVALSKPLADELRADVGDEVILRIPLTQQIPADSPLGKKSGTVRGLRLQVTAIVPAQGLGRFSLRPSQHLPHNAFVPLPVLQRALGKTGQVNAILVAGSGVDTASTEEASDSLQQALHPTLEDYGITVRRVTLGDPQAPTSQYINITSDRMLLPEAVVRSASQALAGEEVQPVLTYLANTIEAGDQKIPYSTISGVDSTAQLGPLTGADGEAIVLANDEIVLNSWAAGDLDVEPGDKITVHFYEPESTHGELKENILPATFKLKAVVPLADPQERPTRAGDPDLTPELPGVTDQASINDWDLPFKLVEKIRPQDDTYWETYRTTPKAFISLARSRELWQSRFGDTSSLRIPAGGDLTVDSVAAKLQIAPADLGFAFQPVKRQGLDAAQGTTSFDQLFLGFSFFIIAAAMMLVAILFRLGVEQRASEVGILTAVGLPQRLVRRLLAAEGVLVAAVGSLLGVAVGVGYAWLMLAGLRSWWLTAIVTPFLELHVTPVSLVLGYLIGTVISLATILWSLRRMARLPAQRLLAGDATEEREVVARQGRSMRYALTLVLVAAVLLGVVAIGLGGEAQAGAFFGSGALVLTASLMFIRRRLRAGGAADGAASKGFGLVGLAMRNGARNPGRSTLTIGLVASASFLIVAISAFRLSATGEGAGGFDLVAESDQPIVHDINTEAGRAELAFGEAENKQLATCTTFALRVLPGDDASCLNLYKPRQPRVLGVPHAMIERGRFAWGATAAVTSEEQDNPWLLLNHPLASGAVPVVLDANTATYSLHLGGVGARLVIDDPRGGTVELEVVGLLENSIFQGDLLVSETNFIEHFPLTTGYRFFLTDVDAAESQPVEAVQAALEETLGDYGFDATAAGDRLAGFLAVQNTYLLTFQSLGALGLLLGTFGVATVGLRNVLERRGELALMRAAGFRRRRLGVMVMLENGLLLLAGLSTGVFAAAVAILPHLVAGGATIPWQLLVAMLSGVLVVGLMAGALAVRAVLNAPLLAALRGD